MVPAAVNLFAPAVLPSWHWRHGLAGVVVPVDGGRRGGDTVGIIGRGHVDVGRAATIATRSAFPPVPFPPPVPPPVPVPPPAPPSVTVDCWCSGMMLDRQPPAPSASRRRRRRGTGCVACGGVHLQGPGRGFTRVNAPKPYPVP